MSHARFFSSIGVAMPWSIFLEVTEVSLNSHYVHTSLYLSLSLSPSHPTTLLIFRARGLGRRAEGDCTSTICFGSF